MIDDHETYSYGEDIGCPSGKGAFCTGKSLSLKKIELKKIGSNYQNISDSEISTETESPPCFGDAGKIVLHHIHS